MFTSIIDIISYKIRAGVASASAEVSGGRIRPEAELQADRGIDKFAALVLYRTLKVDQDCTNYL